MKLLAGLAAAAVLLFATPAQADDLEGRVTADLAQWQVFAYGQAVGLAQVEQAVYDLGVQIDAYVGAVAEAEAAAAQQAQAAAEAARQTVVPAQPQPPAMTQSSSSNTGAHSDAWWHGVAICEQGGQNSPYYGYFSIMDGSAGGKDWSSQVAQANGIISRYGDGAWAAACVAAGYAASPGG